MVPWSADRLAVGRRPFPSLLELYDLDLHGRKPLIVESQQSCRAGTDVKDTLARCTGCDRLGKDPGRLP